MSRARRVAVVGSGLAGLSAAVAAHEHGADVTIFEVAAAPGGATAESAGWLWRYRDAEAAHRYAPAGDGTVQRAIVDRLDDDIQWLAHQGVAIAATETGRTITSGARIEPEQAIAALLEAVPAGTLQLSTEVTAVTHGPSGELEITTAGSDRPVDTADAVVFAGGGYTADLSKVAALAAVWAPVAAHWRLRARRGGVGSSIDAAERLGAVMRRTGGECFVRPASPERDLPSAGERSAWGELLTATTWVLTPDGERVQRQTHDWSGSQSMWTLAASHGQGWLHVPREALTERIHAGQIGDVVEGLTGAHVQTQANGDVRLRIAAGITTTLDGLVVDDDGRLRLCDDATADSLEAPQLFAAGGDAASSGLGGTASGLAQAVVLGRRAGTCASSRPAARAHL